MGDFFMYTFLCMTMALVAVVVVVVMRVGGIIRIHLACHFDIYSGDKKEKEKKSSSLLWWCSNTHIRMWWRWSSLQLDGRKRNKSYEEKRWSWGRQIQNKTSSTQTPPTSSPEGKKRKEFSGEWTVEEKWKGKRISRKSCNKSSKKVSS